MGTTKKSEVKGLFLVVLAMFFLWLVATAFSGIEWRFYDLRARLSKSLFPGDSAAAQNVVIIGIDGVASLRDKPLIFWYPEIAEVITTAAGQGAAAIGIDLIPYHSLSEKLDNVAAEFSDGDGEDGMLDNIGSDLDRSLIAALMRSSFFTPIVQGFNGDIVPFYYGMMAHMANVLPASLMIDYDSDGVLRRVTPVDEDGTMRLVAAVCAATGMCGSEQPFLFNPDFLDRIPHYDFKSFLHQGVDDSAIAGKVVLIGLINGNEDLVHTPLGLFNGIYFHAAGLETLLTKTALRHVPQRIALLTLFLLCLVGYWFAQRQRPLTAFFNLLLLTFFYGLINLYMFSRGLVLPAFPHLFALGFSAAVTYPYRYLVEEKDRKRLFETFSYYVDKSVIDQLIISDAKALMQGEERQVTVMSLDIRNFTSLSNAFPPDKVVQVLNVLFSCLTEVVQKNRGFVNKFIGDGMLAFFPGEEGPVHALHSSLGIEQVVRRINRQGELAEYIGDRQIATGIGLHHGPVILGNIGSQRKMDFTVIGPTVNLAFRIESVTKELKESILVTESVYQNVSQDVLFEKLDTVEVKGFSEPIQVYAPRFDDSQINKAGE
ncbi:MAG: hypothetical protein C0614_00185 [Desulfuromonas sp.]|nr:MAG: hypothetical protein C0614_00185 [Desulfuromonas sp.]